MAVLKFTPARYFCNQAGDWFWAGKSNYFDIRLCDEGKSYFSMIGGLKTELAS